MQLINIMKKANLKYLYIILICFMCVLLIFDTSFAVNTGMIKDYFTKTETNDLDFNKAKNTIFSLLTYLGYGLAVCVTLATGIKFLLANSQQKAQLKEKLLLIFIGVFILAAGVPLMQLIANIIWDMKSTL